MKKLFFILSISILLSPAFKLPAQLHQPENDDQNRVTFKVSKNLALTTNH